MNEKALITLTEKWIIDQKVNDYKCFIGDRKGQDSARYEATVCVIVDVKVGEAVMKSIVKNLKGTLAFHSSGVDLDERRSVDILLFTAELRYDGEANDEVYV